MAVGNGLAASDAFIEATADASSLVMYGGMALPAVAQPSPPLLLDLPPAPWAEGAVRVGDGVRAPFKIRNVPPTYPAEALSARLQGVVILEALSLP